MKIREFTPEDLLNLELQEKQKDDEWLQNEVYANRIGQEEAYTATKDGKVMACLGFLTILPHKAFMWCFVGKGCGRSMFQLCKFTKKVIEQNNKYTRIETTVRSDFIESQKSMKVLGFEREGLMRKSGSDGSDHILYARIK